MEVPREPPVDLYLCAVLEVPQVSYALAAHAQRRPSALTRSRVHHGERGGSRCAADLSP